MALAFAVSRAPARGFLARGASALALAGLLLAGCASRPGGDPVPSDFPVHGIDVSYYQGQIDWAAVRDGGTAFAWIKATEGGDHKDSAFDRNWAQAEAAGVPRGAYHFYYFCRTVQDQIAWFKQVVPQDPDALPPVLDMEWNGHSKTCRTTPPKAQIRRDMALFLREAERHFGKRPVIYTTVDFHRDVLSDGAFSEYPMWVRSVAGHPRKRYGDRLFAFWQYTATGTVPGVKGNVDRNVFHGSWEKWQKFLADGRSGT